MRHVDLGKLVDDLEMVGGSRLGVGSSSTLNAASRAKTTVQDAEDLDLEVV